MTDFATRLAGSFIQGLRPAINPSQRQPMSVYFTSDHHFGQAAARSFYRRPFASVAKMDQEMIDR